MPDVIAVMGMHRSGTSCLAGLLVRCGLSLGNRHRLLVEPRPDNIKGHFENRAAIAINDAVLAAAGGSWDAPPSAAAIESVAGRFPRRFARFERRFDGSIFKDPRTTLTIGLWERFCPTLAHAIACVRHPLAVARSLYRRDRLALERGLDLWHIYNSRFLEAVQRCRIHVVHYDQLLAHTTDEMVRLMGALGVPTAAADVGQRVDGFVDGTLDHGAIDDTPEVTMPEDVAKLYGELLERTTTRSRAG